MDNLIDPRDGRVYREREVIQYDQNGVPLPPAPAQPIYAAPVQPIYAAPAPPPPVYVQPVPAVDARSTHANYGDTRVDNFHETYVDERGNVMERHEEVLDDPYTRRLNILDRTARIAYFLVGALEILLLLRLAFKLLGADATSGIVNFIYNLSNPFVIAFNGILGDVKLSNTSILEISTIVAMFLYALLVWGFVSLLDALFRPNPSSRQTFTSTHRRA